MTTDARICVIDDDVAMLDATALGLRDAGYVVLTAPGAAAGLDIIAREHVDAVVTDMNMPGTSGAQLITEARARWADLPIVAVSGSITSDGASMLDVARSLGADALLAKPFRARDLQQMLGELIEKRQRNG